MSNFVNFVRYHYGDLLMSKKIFISKGSQPTDKQQKFIDAVIKKLEDIGLSPRIMGENEWSHGHPLQKIREIIQECSGVIVIAFTRTKYPEETEIRKNTEITSKEKISLPTTWNHIEAAMGYSFDLPLFVIAEKGLKSEGLIENGYDWSVYWTKLQVDSVENDSFRGVLMSWKNAVDSFDQQKSLPSKTNYSKELTLGMLVESMPLSHFWGLIASILSFLVIFATIFYNLGDT